jgi:hypothetical protein
VDDIVALIDYKNISASGRNPMEGLTRMFRKAIDTAQHYPVIDVVVRLYGGWYDGMAYSEERAKALIYCQEVLPSLLIVDNRPFRFHIQFAESLIGTQDGGNSQQKITFTHTSVTRTAELLGVLRRTVSCSIATCRIPDVRRWIYRKKACLEQGCPHSYSTFFERREQKQVDVHMVSDLLLLSSKMREVVLLTADTDFIPAIVAFAETTKGGRLTWIRPNADISYIDKQLTDYGISIIII